MPYYEHEHVLVEARCGGKVLLVTLNRPGQLNAWTAQMGAALNSAYDRAADDAAVRVVVVTGAGKGFCAGADMGGLNAMGGGARKAGGGAKQAKLLTPIPKQAEDYILHPTRIPKPVIAAVNGACAGIGLSAALAADIRFAAAGAKFTAAFSKRGLIAEHGMSWALPNYAGTGNAMLMMLSSDVFTAEECKGMGIIQRVFPADRLLEETLRFAERLANNTPPASLAVIKQQAWHHPHMDRKEAVLESNRLMYATAGPRNPDFKEGVKSFMEKRAPSFGPYDPTRDVVQLGQKLFERKGAKLAKM